MERREKREGASITDLNNLLPKLVQRPCNRNLSSGNNKVSHLICYFLVIFFKFLQPANRKCSFSFGVEFQTIHCLLYIHNLECPINSFLRFFFYDCKRLLDPTGELYVYTQNSGHFLFTHRIGRANEFFADE